MFGWFKKKEESHQDRYQKIALCYQALENGLKGVENHWSIGNKKQGDELFEQLFGACFANFLGGAEEGPDFIRLAQFEGLKDLIKFLIKHSKHVHINKLIKKIPLYVNSFKPDQLEYLIHIMDVSKEALQSSQGESDYRLVYYVCQHCGKLNLISTAPCVHCGFAATTERTYRRALLLSSQILQTPILLRLGSDLELGQQANPIKQIDEVWALGESIDQAADQHTQVYNDQLAKLLRFSLNNAKSFNGPPNLSVKCPSCENIQGISTHFSVQNCVKCDAQIPTPHFRRLKATLDNCLNWITNFADHSDDTTYANFISMFVLITDYALRRDTTPTKEQGRNLIARFASIAPLNYLSGQFQIRIENRLAIGHCMPSASLSVEVENMFTLHVMTINCLFDMLSSGELQP